MKPCSDIVKYVCGKTECNQAIIFTCSAGLINYLYFLENMQIAHPLSERKQAFYSVSAPVQLLLVRMTLCFLYLCNLYKYLSVSLG